MLPRHDMGRKGAKAEPRRAMKACARHHRDVGIARPCASNAARTCAPPGAGAQLNERESMPDDDRNKDVLLLHSPTEDGDGVRVVRSRRGKVEVGEVRNVAECKPLTGELVTLKPREGAPRVCDVEVH